MKRACQHTNTKVEFNNNDESAMLVCRDCGVIIAKTA